MERTKGGYIILDLTMIQLSVIAETSISNAEVLKQLFSLSDYAMKPYTKLKPIYLRAVSNTGVEVVSLCELERNGLVLRIKAFILDVIVEVVVDFENKTAKYEVVSEANRILNEVESAEGGSIVNALGLDSDGGLVKENLSDRIIDEVESAEEGTIDKVLGLDSDGGLVKGAVSGGTKLYKHSLNIYDGPNLVTTLSFIASDNSKADDLTTFYNLLDKIITIGLSISSTSHSLFILDHTVEGLLKCITVSKSYPGGPITLYNRTYDIDTDTYTNTSITYNRLVDTVTAL